MFGALWFNISDVRGLEEVGLRFFFDFGAWGFKISCLGLRILGVRA